MTFQTCYHRLLLLFKGVQELLQKPVFPIPIIGCFMSLVLDKKERIELQKNKTRIDRLIDWTSLSKNYKIIKFLYFCEKVQVSKSLSNIFNKTAKTGPIFKIQAAIELKLNKYQWE